MYKMITKNELLSSNIIKVPSIVLTSNLYGFFAWRIRVHTKNAYSHAMILHKRDKFASQDKKFQSVPIEDYLSGKFRIKIWYSPKWSIKECDNMLKKVNEDLEKGGKYDWIGIIGYFLGLKYINSKNRNYCSEHVKSILHLTNEGLKWEIENPSPGEIDKYFSSKPDIYKALVYDPTI